MKEGNRRRARRWQKRVKKTVSISVKPRVSKGKKCFVCGDDLTGNQRFFCSKQTCRTEGNYRRTNKSMRKRAGLDVPDEPRGVPSGFL